MCYHSILLSVFTDHCGRGCLPRMVNVLSPLRPARLQPGRGALYGLGRMAYRQAAHCPALAAGHHGQRGSSVQGDLCQGARSETIPQLGTIWPEVKWSHFRLLRLARVLAVSPHPIAYACHCPYPPPLGCNKEIRFRFVVF